MWVERVGPLTVIGRSIWCFISCMGGEGGAFDGHRAEHLVFH